MKSITDTVGEYVETLLQEKGISKDEEFVIEHNDTVHFVDLAFVVELIKQCSNKEAKTIRATLVMLDFKNANVLDYFKHLATGYVKTNF